MAAASDVIYLTIVAMETTWLPVTIFSSRLLGLIGSYNYVSAKKILVISTLKFAYLMLLLF